jgi:hypothetical protein
MRTWIAVSLLAVLFSLSSSAASDKWLHVRVEDNGPRGERVNVNLPLDLIERMLPLISVDDLRGGKLELDDELGGIDLRELAVALRDAPDADFVTVQSDDQNVRVSKEGDYLLIRVEERGRNSSEKVRVRLPLAVVDALVGGNPNELDLVAALHALSEYADETLVDIESDDGSVRVWIDSSETGL